MSARILETSDRTSKNFASIRSYLALLYSMPSRIASNWTFTKCSKLSTLSESFSNLPKRLSTLPERLSTLPAISATVRAKSAMARRTASFSSGFFNLSSEVFISDNLPQFLQNFHFYFFVLKTVLNAIFASFQVRSRSILPSGVSRPSSLSVSSFRKSLPSRLNINSLA